MITITSIQFPAVCQNINNLEQFIKIFMLFLGSLQIFLELLRKLEGISHTSNAFFKDSISW